MSKTIVVYGSSTGSCESIAQTLGRKLNAEVIEVTALSVARLEDADNILLGTSTWGVGELQDDWYDGIKILKQADLSGKKVALFGCGDSSAYSETFCSGMKELYDAVLETGAALVGDVSADGYEFDSSEALVDGRFVGLPLDEVNEDDKTEGRIDTWIPTLGF